jgi:hypothetical protein
VLSHETLSPAARSVAGRWSSPRAPATFHRCRSGPRGVPWRAALPLPKLRDVGPHGLDLSFRALLVRLETLATPDKSGSWIPPLMALPACASSLFLSARVHSRMLRRASLGSPVPPDDFPFRPRGLSPPRRFPPRVACGFVAPRSQP